MKQTADAESTLAYIQTDLTRIQGMVGTLADAERKHSHKLTNFESKELHDIAVEEQSAARQLDTIKEMCTAMNRRIEEVMSGIGVKRSGEGDGDAKKVH